MRVLIVKVSSLGDIIHTLPAVTDAHRAHRGLSFDWVVEENFVDVPSWHPAVDRVIPVAIRRWRRNLWRTALNREVRAFKKTLQTERYDLVIDAQGLIKSGIISRMSRGLTIGLSNHTIREPLATLFYNKRYSVPWEDHAVDRIRQLFSRALKHDYDKDEINYGLDTSLVDAESIVNHKQLVFLHGTTWATKHWPESYWRHLAHIATENGYSVLLPWGNEAERQRAERVAAGNEQVTVLERMPLKGVARMIYRSAGVIAVDTGLGHLAAALSKPTLSLYGPTNPGLSGTFGHQQIHMKSNLNCSPCVKKVCSYSGPGVSDAFQGKQFAVEPPCFASHQPETVWTQFQKLLPMNASS